eukprot:1548050-Prymnesium_polylepis.1
MIVEKGVSKQHQTPHTTPHQTPRQATQDLSPRFEFEVATLLRKLGRHVHRYAQEGGGPKVFSGVRGVRCWSGVAGRKSHNRQTHQLGDSGPIRP